MQESNGEDVGEQSQTGAQSSRSRSGRGGSSGFAVNSFEHRHRAQQQLLEQQQQQLREQRRLIDEMQALQRQQMLQQRLAGARQQPKMAGSDGEFEPLHLHRALASIQHEVLADTGSADSARSVEQMQR